MSIFHTANISNSCAKVKYLHCALCKNPSNSIDDILFINSTNVTTKKVLQIFLLFFFFPGVIRSRQQQRERIILKLIDIVAKLKTVKSIRNNKKHVKLCKLRSYSHEFMRLIIVDASIFKERFSQTFTKNEFYLNYLLYFKSSFEKKYLSQTSFVVTGVNIFFLRNFF